MLKYIYFFFKFIKLHHLFYKYFYFLKQKYKYPINIKIKDENFFIKKITKSKLPKISHKIWLNNIKDFQKYVKSNGLKHFLNHPTILNSMFLRDSLFSHGNSFIKNDLKFLKKKIKIQDLDENNIGMPILSKFLGTSSANLIHHAGYFETFLDKFNIINKLSYVFEFGGGYGSFARYVLTKKNLSYALYDFEIFTHIQSFYLSNLFKKKKIEYYYKIDQLKKIKIKKNSLFVSTFSLSETPLRLRNKFKKFITKFDYILITFQKNFEEYDNYSYFGNFLDKRKYMIEIIEMKNRKKMYYLFAKKL